MFDEHFSPPSPVALLPIHAGKQLGIFASYRIGMRDRILDYYPQMSWMGVVKWTPTMVGLVLVVACIVQVHVRFVGS